MKQITEKPIIFSPLMVRAIIDGGKNQTRRLVKYRGKDKKQYPIPTATEFTGIKCGWHTFETETDIYSVKPKYQSGDILWVKEKYGYLPIPNFNESKLYYTADANPELTDLKIKWISPLFMPRKIARTFLRVINVHAERLQDISTENLHNELGIMDVNSPCNNCRGKEIIGCLPPCDLDDKFSDLWNSLNAKCGFGWEVNPWVWVIEFERIISYI